MKYWYEISWMGEVWLSGTEDFKKRPLKKELIKKMVDWFDFLVNSKDVRIKVELKK